MEFFITLSCHNEVWLIYHYGKTPWKPDWILYIYACGSRCSEKYSEWAWYPSHRLLPILVAISAFLNDSCCVSWDRQDYFSLCPGIQFFTQRKKRRRQYMYMTNVTQRSDRFKKTIGSKVEGEGILIFSQCRRKNDVLDSVCGPPHWDFEPRFFLIFLHFQKIHPVFWMIKLGFILVGYNFYIPCWLWAKSGRNQSCTSQNPAHDHLLIRTISRRKWKLLWHTRSSNCLCARWSIVQYQHSCNFFVMRLGIHCCYFVHF